LAARKAIDIALMANPDVSKFTGLAVALSFMTPVSHRGWGCPTLVMTALKEMTDSLSRPVALAKMILANLPLDYKPTPTNIWVTQDCSRYIKALLSEDFRIPSVWSFLQAPPSVFFQDVKDPSGSIANILKGAIMKLGPCAEMRKLLSSTRAVRPKSRFGSWSDPWKQIVPYLR
jgi:hypothetical protein